ncbi:MAG: hypothetical protein AAGC55_32080 [Myxococcota bacterium]
MKFKRLDNILARQKKGVVLDTTMIVVLTLVAAFGLSAITLTM